MKKYTILLTSLILAGSVLLSACSKDSGNNASSSSNSSPNSSASDASGTSSSNTSAATTALQPINASDMSKLPQLAQQRTDTIIAGLTDPSGSFTPYFQQSGYDGNVSGMLYTPLVTVDDKGLPTPGLAEKWDVSSDQLTYTYHLRQGLKFSNGSPITAADVAFTWTILNDPSYDGDSLVPTAGIKGAADYKAGKAKTISGIKVTDPQTISVTLEKPNATALTLLGSDVLSKAYYGKDYKFGNLDYMKTLSSKPLGTGPYKLDKFIPGQEVRMVANENYYLGKPKTEHFIYKTSQGDTWQYLQTGEVDYATFTATQENIDKLKSMGFVNIVPYTPSTYSYLQVNFDHPALQDKLVRQAIAYGLDRQSIYVDANGGAGQVANIPASPNSWSYTEDGINPYKFDSNKANELLDQAGWKMGSDGIREKDGKKLTIHFLGSKSTATDTFIAVATEDFKAIGVDYQPEVFSDFNALVSKVEGGDYDLASFSTSQLLDPLDGVMQFVDGELKDYKDPKVLELYNKALATSDIEQRKQVYAELYKYLNDQLPVIFTNYKKSVYAYNSRIENLVNSPFTGLSANIANWNLKK